MAETPYRGQAYGQAKLQEEAMETVPMADLVDTNMRVAPGSAGAFTRPTGRPGEMLNEAAVIPPTETMADGPLGNPNAMRLLEKLLVLGDVPTVSNSTKAMLREISALAAFTDIERG
ncbi:MAG: hypothetical protein CL981_07550 [Euryarchaeota archaeon]|nr:hypothetical protein [Euryarchaeota archaeon]|tara:strand:- start:481 stop:831 length:351 start_codon:yes stop_codon:yes gene_type:complete